MELAEVPYHFPPGKWTSGIIISHVGSGIFPVDGVGRISYGHCCIFPAASIFVVMCQVCFTIECVITSQSVISRISDLQF